jgi:hypothetical protein|tara:strand:+ start:466 stop:684 length:219 start_codon:yes stop_codon:yes gene_type:complete
MAKIVEYDKAKKIGKLWASTEKVEQRLKICDSCEHKVTILKKSLKVDCCNECGCVLKAKAPFEHFKCPIGKW